MTNRANIPNITGTNLTTVNVNYSIPYNGTNNQNAVATSAKASGVINRHGAKNPNNSSNRNTKSTAATQSQSNVIERSYNTAYNWIYPKEKKAAEKAKFIATVVNSQEKEFYKILDRHLASAKRTPNKMIQPQLFDYITSYITKVIADKDYNNKVNALRNKLENELSPRQFEPIKSLFDIATAATNSDTVQRPARKRAFLDSGLEVSDEYYSNFINRKDEHYWPSSCIINDPIDPANEGKGAMIYTGNGNGYWGTLYYAFQLIGNQLIFRGSSENAFNGYVYSPNGSTTHNSIVCANDDIEMTWGSDLSLNHAKFNSDGEITLPWYEFYSSPYLDSVIKFDLAAGRKNNSYFLAQDKNNSFAINLFKTDSTGHFNSTFETVQRPGDISEWGQTSLLEKANNEISAFYTNQGGTDLLGQDYDVNGTKKGAVKVIDTGTDNLLVRCPQRPLVNPFPCIAVTTDMTQVKIIIYDEINNNITQVIPIAVSQKIVARIASCGPKNKEWFPYVRKHYVGDITGNTGDYDIKFNLVNNKGEFALAQDVTINSNIDGVLQERPYIQCLKFAALTQFESGPAGGALPIQAKHVIVNFAKAINATDIPIVPPLYVNTNFTTFQSNETQVLSEENVQVKEVDELTLVSATNVEVTFTNGSAVPLPYKDTPENMLNNSIVVRGIDNNSSNPKSLEIIGCNKTKDMCVAGAVGVASVLAGAFEPATENDSIPNWIWYVVGSVGFILLASIVIGAYVYNRKDNKEERQEHKDATANRLRIEKETEERRKQNEAMQNAIRANFVPNGHQPLWMNERDKARAQVNMENGHGHNNTPNVPTFWTAGEHLQPPTIMENGKGAPNRSLPPPPPPRANALPPPPAPTQAFWRNGTNQPTPANMENGTAMSFGGKN